MIRIETILWTIGVALLGLASGLAISSAVIPEPTPQVATLEALLKPQTSKVEKEVITLDGGGNIFEFIDKYNRYASDGTKVEVRGVCASACTFFLGLLPHENVCYTDNALLGFHGTYNGLTGQFDPVMTKWTYDYVYTEDDRNILAKYGLDGNSDVDYTKYPTGLVWLKGSEFNMKKCEESWTLSNILNF